MLDARDVSLPIPCRRAYDRHGDLKLAAGERLRYPNTSSQQRHIFGV